jgi:hypothetical protein
MVKRLNSVVKGPPSVARTTASDAATASPSLPSIANQSGDLSSISRETSRVASRSATSRLALEASGLRGVEGAPS